MSQLENASTTVADVMKALSDPTRWEIVRQIADTDELPCAVLESTLPLSKPTISYHTNILGKAGLITARKSGRNFYYSLNRQVLDELMDKLWALAPHPRPVRQVRLSHGPLSRRRPARKDGQGVDRQPTQGDVPLLTW
jgi:DNA-binding transcriptional ArsR family regulator